MASWMQSSSPALVAQPKKLPAGVLGRRLRLAQLVLSVAATAVLTSCDIFRRYMVPVAALQCAWAAAAAVADVHVICGASGRRRPRPNSWALWASVVLDGFTALATFTAASGALGVAHVVVTTACAQEPVMCRDIVTGAAPKALLAWAALQIPATYCFLVQICDASSVASGDARHLNFSVNELFEWLTSSS